MSKHILVTGLAGSGKSACAKEMIKRGYEAYDIETIHGLFNHIDTTTNRISNSSYKNTYESSKHTKWICNIDEINKILKNQKNETAFYFGVASNITELLPMFNTCIVLSATPKQIHERLSKRFKDEYGSDKELQNWIISGKELWESKLVKSGAKKVKEPGVVDDTINVILKCVK